MLEMHADMLSPITRKLHATGAKVGRLTRQNFLKQIQQNHFHKQTFCNKDFRTYLVNLNR